MKKNRSNSGKDVIPYYAYSIMIKSVTYSSSSRLFVTPKDAAITWIRNLLKMVMSQLIY